MAIVTGVLADFSRKALSSSSVNRAPVIEFRPSGPALKSSGAVLYATRTITTEPAVSTGTWTVDLEQTDVLFPHVWYEVAIKWLDSDGNFISEDIVPGRLYVPSGGGTFTDLFRAGSNPLQAWVQPSDDIPPEALPQDLLLDTSDGWLYRIA